MPPEPRTPAILQFGVFEVDLHARELYKQGVRLKVQEQPFRVLTVLLQRFGEVVSREELRAQIWPKDTFVDFDANLNTSINKLREALGDSAENPRFIETMPRRGYRFITPVTAGVGTARATISKVSAGVPASALKIAPTISRHGVVLPWVIAAAAVLVAAVVGLGWWRSNPPVEQPLVRLDVDLGAQITLPAPALNGSSVIISPDGTRLVFVASVAGGRPKLFTRKLDQPNVTELAGTEEASAPFFSADGQWVGFSANNKLNKISPKGGEVVPLVDVAYFAGGSWNEDGNIIVGRAMKDGMARISSSGGASTALTELASGEGFHGNPQILPGAKAVLFVAGAIGNPDKNTIDVVSLEDRRRKTVVRGAASARYLQSGHLVYVREGTLFAIPFDLARLEARGTAVPVLDQVAYNAITDAAQFDLSRNGTLVYRQAGAHRMSTVQWHDATGKKEPLLAKPGEYKEPRLSPDGKRLVLVVIEGGRHDIWVYDWQRDIMTRLTFDGGPYGDPTWTPDGRYVVFDSYQGSIFWTHADGATQPQPLTQSKTFQVPVSFTPDGKRLAYHETSSSGVNRIWTVPVENNGSQLRAGKPEQFLNGQFSQGFAEFSPDGHWLAYTGDETGKYEVYVRAFPVPESGAGGKWQISNLGGQAPRWSRNGHELLYYAGDQIMTARYSGRVIRSWLTSRSRGGRTL